ncbi:MAG TPA: MopE-related protein [Anaeromyxobacteraceae bacterium]|nr:MopE-related protein [Anaeromyxobacteraceae bacterium]
MRHPYVSRLAVSLLALSMLGAPCGTQGPQSRSFSAGSLVIPMDNCYQKRDKTSASGGGTIACNVAADDGVFRAYGLVYFLLKNNVRVYWAVDGATPKTQVTGVDVPVPAPASGVVIKRYDWASGKVVTYDAPGCATPGTCPYTAGTGINYIGGPFVIDAADAPAALSLFNTGADFAAFRAQAMVDIHEVETGFTAPQVRPLAGPPPKLAILNITPPAGKKTAANVMYQYAVAAGLSWPCVGNGDCAGGLGPGCKLSTVLAYLANPAGDRAIPQVCTPTGCTAGTAGCLCAPNFNTGSNAASDIYDLLCDGDFIPPAAGTTYADTQLAQGNYKLLWVPHWDTGGVVPTGSTDASVTPVLPPATTADRLAWELRDIASFVKAGNNLFVECLGIQALEGVTGQTNVNGPLYGIPATRFQTPAGILKWNGSYSSTQFLDPAQPNVQVGDFQYSLVTGAITTFYPNGSLQPPQAYLAGVDRLIVQPATTTTAVPPSWDIASTFQTQSPDSAIGGSVAYLGGHDYSPSVDGAVAGQTAGTRIVLNTLFNLGFACADPNTSCNTGLLGVCAEGVLKCSSSGGYTCVQTVFPSPEVCDGKDNNCNGLVDEGGVCNPPVCQEGSTRPCYDGPAGTQGKGTCAAGTQTCSSGVWGACVGEVLPQPPVCNGKDNDCDGQLDTQCPTGEVCTNGFCLPNGCGVEGPACPTGYTCQSGACQPILCNGSACPAGRICQSGACVDPCAGVTCGPGSVCAAGTCQYGGCAFTGCATGQACVQGQCVADPCAAANCPTGTFCRSGDCVRACAYVACPTGQSCSVDGFCEVPPCGQSCGQGQACVNGSCVTDPCIGVGCGAGQVCQGGACVDDPCSEVHCPVGACANGQCFGGVTPSTGGGQAPKSGKGGGCSSAGGADLAGLGLLALALGPRLRRRSRRAGAPLALLAVVAVGLSACGSSGSSCPSGQVDCGSGCVDQATDPHNCGSCGATCSSGFVCQGGCVFPTGNPFLRAVDPSSLSPGQTAAFHLTGDGFQAGARARFTGAGVSVEQPLSVASLSSASVTVDLTGATSGSLLVRVLNPNPGGGSAGPLVSNTVPVTLTGDLLLESVSPAGILQSDAGPDTLALTGLGFQPGMVASLSAPSTSVPSVDLPTTVASAQAATAVVANPGSLTVGVLYNIGVRNSGGGSSSLKFQVNEGIPVLKSVSNTCVNLGSYIVAAATGSYFYPTSVAHVSGPGVQDSVLPTTCASGNLVLGQCANGMLNVVVDLTGQSPIQPGSYNITIVNPGYPTTNASQPIAVTVKAAASPCP